MCTVSFIPRSRGYALMMNRDEKRTRIAGLPPQLHKIDRRAVLYPSEPGGGTWISLNDTGVTLVLINWYSVNQRVVAGVISRGQVVNSACAAGTKDQVDSVVAPLPLAKINPFRLIGIFLATSEVFEWRWNLSKLEIHQHPWRPQQWISSGFDEPKAQQIRSATFRRAQTQNSAGTLEWLRRLHRSHHPDCGAFSTCMHRADAATVSSTEIVVSSGRATMRHHPGPPCQTSNQIVRHVNRI